MLVLRSLVTMLAGASVGVFARHAAAEPAPPPAEVHASGSPDAGAGVRVLFDGSAAGLDQDGIRAAIARELAKAEPQDRAQTGDMTISLLEAKLLVRFRSRDRAVERSLPLPDERETIPEVLGLLAVNLAHDQSAFARSAASAPPPVVPVPPSPASGRASLQPRREVPNHAQFARHWFGVHFGSAQLILNGTPVCQPGGDPSYTCYVVSGPQQGQTYVAKTKSDALVIDGGASGPHRSQMRLLVSYDGALTPKFTVGGRLGYAFRNGWLGGPDEYADGKSGVLLPLHLEARAKWWFLPLTRRHTRAFVGAGGGVAEYAAHELLSAPDITVDAWKQAGKGFVSGDAGFNLGLFEGLAVELSLEASLLFPRTGATFGTYFGVLYGL